MQEMQEMLGSILGVAEITWGRKWGPTPVLLPGKFHGRRSLVGYSPWGCKKSDMTEWLSIHTQVENHMQKYSQEGFFFLQKWNTNVKTINITKLLRMIFKAWFGYFEYISHLLHWYNTEYSQLIYWFDHYQLQLVYPTMKHCPVRNLQHEALQTTFTLLISHSSFSICFTNLLFSFKFHFYLFWNNKA